MTGGAAAVVEEVLIEMTDDERVAVVLAAFAENDGVAESRTGRHHGGAPE